MFGKKTKKVIEINVEARNELIQAGKLKGRLEDMLNRVEIVNRKNEDDVVGENERVRNDILQRIELVDKEIELIVKKAKRQSGLKIHTNAKKYSRDRAVELTKVKDDTEIDEKKAIIVNGEVIL